MTIRFFGSSRSRPGATAAGYIGCLLSALLPSIPTSAQTAENSTFEWVGSIDPPAGAAQWALSAEAIILQRVGGANQTLISRVPGSTPFYAPAPFYDTASYPGAEAFNANQLRPGFSAGPKLDLFYSDPSGFGLELSYFNIFNQSAAQAIGPNGPATWLVMKAPGTFWQTQDFPYQAMTWDDVTSLYSAEANGRWALSRSLTLLAGFRWLHLNDALTGALSPADRNAPTWKQTDPFDNLFQVAPGNAPAGSYPPFWTTNTANNLFGVQIGATGPMWELGRFSFDGTIKAGLFDNDAEQSAGVSMQKKVYPSQAATDQPAFVSEAGLELKYRVAQGLTLKVGYEALWLDGVALAAGQIQETLTTPTSVRALGVNSRSSVLFQGADFGFEFAF